MVNQEGPRLKSSGCDSISPPSNVQNRRTQHSRRETEAQRGMGLISGHPRLLATSPTSSPLWLRQSVVCAKLWHPAPTNPHQPPGFPPDSSFRPWAGTQAPFPRGRDAGHPPQNAMFPSSFHLPSKVSSPQSLEDPPTEALAGQALIAAPPPFSSLPDSLLVPPSLLRN